MLYTKLVEKLNSCNCCMQKIDGHKKKEVGYKRYQKKQPEE